MATQQEPLVDRLIAHALETSYAQLPADAVQRALWRLIDSVGVGLAGHRADGIDQLLQVVRNWGAGDESAVLGSEIRLPAASAAFANAVLIRSFDYEPVEAFGPGGRQVAAHISGSTVPVALAVGEAVGASGADVIAALVLGDDFTARLAVAAGFDVYSGQDNTGTVNALGSALIAARLYGLNHEQTRHALGIALNQAAGTVASIFDFASSFKLPIAFAARAGIVAAQLAKAGITGPTDPVQGRFGFLQVFSAAPQPELLVEELGREYFGDCTHKPFAACRASHPSLQACLELVSQHGLSAKDIAKVQVHVTERTLNGFVGARFTPGDTRTEAALFSIHLTAAAALLHGRLTPAELGAEALSDPLLHQLLERIELVGSLPNQQRLTAEVTATLHDGSTRHVRVEHPSGNILRTALSADQLSDKFIENVEYGLPALAPQARQLLEALLNLPQHDSVQLLIAELHPQTNFIATP